MRRILVALDGSEAANDALDAALLLAHETGPELIALAVRVVLTQGVPFGMRPVSLDPVGADVGEVLRAARERARHAGYELDTLVREGRPAAEIVRAADDLDVDLVVLGSRGLGALRSALLGSVSRSVLLHARRPVLVVKHQPQHALVRAP